MPTYVCPTCGREVTVDRREDARDRPFCSRRCRLIDLGRWFNEEYRISDPIETHPHHPPPPPGWPPDTVRDGPDATGG